MKNLTHKVPSFVEVAILLGQKHAPHIVEKIYRYFYDVRKCTNPKRNKRYDFFLGMILHSGV
jgi:hypothetical protein